MYHCSCTPNFGYTAPAELADELCRQVGPFIQGPPTPVAEFGWIDPQTFIDVVNFKNDWFARAAKYLIEKENPELFFFQSHSIDHAQHLWMRQADPLTSESPQQAREYMGYLRAIYSSCDAMLGKMIELADENTVVVVVSDHGGKTCGDMRILGPWLEEHGATVVTYRYEPGGHGIFSTVRPGEPPSPALTALLAFIGSLKD